MTAAPEISQRVGSERVGQRALRRAFFGAAALLFVVSASVTIILCRSMPAASGTPMRDGWPMSMMWMRMQGQTWAGASASFVGMWSVMMVAMMLPSLTPMLWRYFSVVEAALCDHTRASALTALMAVGYFFIWVLLGTVVFGTGVALAAIEMELPMISRAVPIGTAVVVLIAGALQLTAWKARRLACCGPRVALGRMLPIDTGAAWRRGLELGLRCVYCCAGPTAALLCLGMMDLRVMTVVASAITAERLAPEGQHVARAVGAVGIVAGLMSLAHATGLG